MRTQSYVVRIRGNENGTWQGVVEHIQTGQKMPFRSCLEMLKAMESAMQLPQAPVTAEESELPSSG